MRYLIISDMHANLPALEAVLADAAHVGYDQVLVLGDLVGYGGDPGPVLERTLGLAPAAIIRGNHDKVGAGLESAAFFNDIARASIEWTKATLTPAQLLALAALPKGPRTVVEGLEICHGSPFDEDYYVFDEADAVRAIDAASERLCLYGHTHVPAVFFSGTTPANGSDVLGGPDHDTLTLPSDGRVLINVGSVGQPRDGDPRAAYGVLDLARHVIQLRRVAYDIAAAQKTIRDAGLPAWLGARLERGQ